MATESHQRLVKFEISVTCTSTAMLLHMSIFGVGYTNSSTGGTLQHSLVNTLTVSKSSLRP